jgi:hypothetical protein
MEGVTGKYFIDKEPVRSSDASYDPDAGQRLWEISENLCDLETTSTASGDLEITTEIPMFELVEG